MLRNGGGRMLRSAMIPLVASTAAGCGSSATLYTHDGGHVTGEITAGDDERIVVADAERSIGSAWDPERDGPPTRPIREAWPELTVDRAEVEQIDHPGTGLMITGGVLMALGGFIALSPPTRTSSGSATVDTSRGSPNVQMDLDIAPDLSGAFGAGFAIAGGGLMAWGLARYVGSVRALDTAPTVGVGPGSVSLSGRF